MSARKLPGPEELLALGAATLGESGAEVTDPRLKPAWAGAAVAGPAVPVRCAPGDNLAVHVAVAESPPGSVLVVEVGSAPGRGYWGEVLTTGAQARGLAGLVIDGGVRDVEALAALRFPVFSSSIVLRGAAKIGPGALGVPVRVGGATVSPGDWVVGDADGVVVLPGATLADVASAGRARAEKEAGYFEALRGGKTTVDLLSLDTSRITRR